MSDKNIRKIIEWSNTLPPKGVMTSFGDDNNTNIIIEIDSGKHNVIIKYDVKSVYWTVLFDDHVFFGLEADSQVRVTTVIEIANELLQENYKYKTTPIDSFKYIILKSNNGVYTSDFIPDYKSITNPSVILSPLGIKYDKTSKKDYALFLELYYSTTSLVNNELHKDIQLVPNQLADEFLGEARDICIGIFLKSDMDRMPYTQANKLLNKVLIDSHGVSNKSKELTKLVVELHSIITSYRKQF